MRMTAPTLALLAAVGCTSSTSQPTTVVVVRAADDKCELGANSLTAGLVGFKVTNSGTVPTEVSVQAARKVLGHVSAVPVRGTQTFSARISAGVVELVCKPRGASGAIRTVVVVRPAGM